MMTSAESAERNRTRKSRGKVQARIRKGRIDPQTKGVSEWDEFDERCAAEGDSSVLIGWVSAPSWHHEGDVENSKGWAWINYRLGYC